MQVSCHCVYFALDKHEPLKRIFPAYGDSAGNKFARHYGGTEEEALAGASRKS
jgi:hypothetical protein